jgi:hypothetical protein
MLAVSPLVEAVAQVPQAKTANLASRVATAAWDWQAQSQVLPFFMRAVAAAQRSAQVALTAQAGLVVAAMEETQPDTAL